jgi:hypothetical protein
LLQDQHLKCDKDSKIGSHDTLSSSGHSQSSNNSDDTKINTSSLLTFNGATLLLNAAQMPHFFNYQLQQAQAQNNDPNNSIFNPRHSAFLTNYNGNTNNISYNTSTAKKTLQFNNNSHLHQGNVVNIADLHYNQTDLLANQQYLLNGRVVESNINSNNNIDPLSHIYETISLSSTSNVNRMNQRKSILNNLNNQNNQNDYNVFNHYHLHQNGGNGNQNNNNNGIHLDTNTNMLIIDPNSNQRSSTTKPKSKKNKQETNSLEVSDNCWTFKPTPQQKSNHQRHQQFECEQSQSQTPSSSCGSTASTTSTTDDFTCPILPDASSRFPRHPTNVMTISNHLWPQQQQQQQQQFSNDFSEFQRYNPNTTGLIMNQHTATNRRSINHNHNSHKQLINNNTDDNNSNQHQAAVV